VFAPIIFRRRGLRPNVQLDAIV